MSGNEQVATEQVATLSVPRRPDVDINEDWMSQLARANRVSALTACAYHQRLVEGTRKFKAMTAALKGTVQLLKKLGVDTENK